MTKSVDDVVVAIGIKAVAAIVAGDRHADAAAEHFVDDGDATPSRRAALLPVLQIHIDCRQRHHRDFGFRQQIERAIDLGLRLHRQTATMTADHTALVAMPHRRASDEW